MASTWKNNVDRSTDVDSYCVFIIGYLNDIVNPDIIEDYINGAPIIVSDKQSNLMLPMNFSLSLMQNDLEANE